MFVQDHIHMSIYDESDPTANLSAAPEFAPVYRWKVTDRLAKVYTMHSVGRSLNGKLRASVMMKNGSPLKFYDYQFKVALDATDDPLEILVARLQAMAGSRIHFCDVIHPNDGEDHRSMDRRMFVASVGELQVFDNLLTRYYIDVALQDDHSA